MYKSKLQQHCQSKEWNLPEYTTTKEGLDHCPRFKAFVTVNGFSFSTPDLSKSSKEAQNMVAKLAFDHLTGSLNTSSSSLVRPTFDGPQPKTSETFKAASLSGRNSTNRDVNKFKGSLNTSSSSLVRPTFDDPQPKTNETFEASSLSGTNSTNRDVNKFKDMAHLYKNQLQTYAQKRNLVLPVFLSERQGPPHACRYKSKVLLEGKTYESLEYYSTIKDSENAAAKVALMSVSSDGIEEEDPSFFKNLLRELAQRKYSCLPEYETTSLGASHMPKFISTVEIKGESFRGQEAKTKKLAEMNAAKVAYIALKERKIPFGIADFGNWSRQVPGQI